MHSLLLIPALKVPVERFALVTDPSCHVLLASAQSAFGDGVAAAFGEKILGHTGGIAVALLATRVVVPLGGTLVTLQPNKVRLANALTLTIKR